MIKRIRTDQVRIGMFLDSLEGNWLAHPFWTSRFALDNASDLQTLRNSGIAWVRIDTSRGLDVIAVENLTQEREKVPSMPIALLPAETPQPSLSEFRQTVKLLNRSKEAVIDIFREARMGQAINIERCLPLIDEICNTLARDTPVLINLARLKSKDEYTYMHSVAVSALMIALARQIGLDPEKQRVAGLAGLLHDIGKITVPPSILNKPGKLTEPELSLVRTHPERGHEILLGLGGLSAPVLEVCLHHHERYDGAGYPRRLCGPHIGLFARMATICDVYDALTSDRPYKNAWDAAAALAHMASWEGQFDPHLFQSFVKVVGIYPVGSLVRLKSERLGVVTAQNPGRLTHPQVKVFYCAQRRHVVPVELLDLADSMTRDGIAQREDPERWGFTHLERLWLPETEASTSARPHETPSNSDTGLVTMKAGS